MIDDSTIQVVAGAIGTIIPLLISFLIGHKVVSKRSLSKAYSYAVFAASAAEELYGTEAGQAAVGAVKRQYALDRLAEKHGLNEADAELLLHAAVNGLRASGLKPRRTPPAPIAPVALVSTPGGEAA